MSLALRLLLDQAYKDRRVILTRDAKLFKYQYLAGDHVYKVKSLIKKDQLLEVHKCILIL